MFNVLKVGLTLLVTFVSRKMLGNARLEPATFLERIGNLRARQRFVDGYEHITFEYNVRDRDMMGLLAAHCKEINAMNLPMRSGNTLRVAVQAPPLSKRRDST